MVLDSDDAVFRFVWSSPGPDARRTYLSIRGYANCMNECGKALNDFLGTNAEFGRIPVSA